ncbi:MAG: hypothetical protein IKQ61_05860 [Spirochaetales bacterium]|nr:hypothetical protein [Spirochaetales bacterium]
MKRFVSVIMCIIIMMVFISCPSNIQQSAYCIYTVSGVVYTSDGETPVKDILLEVRKYKVEEKNTNISIIFPSADGNIIAASAAYARGSGEDSSSSSSDDSSSSEDSSSSSGDESSSSSSSEAGSSSSSSSSESEDTTTDKKSSADENPVLASCLSADDGSYSLTFKAYLSKDKNAANTDNIFYIYASNDSSISQADNCHRVEFTQEGISAGNPYGSYHSQSAKCEYNIKLIY